MKTILCMLVALSAFGQTKEQPEFTVVGLDSVKLAAYKAADAKLSAATEALRAAQEVAKDAQAKYSAARADLISEFGAFDGECSISSTSAYRSRRYRRVELRLPYAIVAEGHEFCSNITYLEVGGASMSSGSNNVYITGGDAMKGSAK